MIFCSHCGAPQVLLSEELQTQIEAQAKAAADGASGGPAAPDPSTLVWAGALRYVALAAAITAVLSCLSILLPPVVLLSMFWAAISPVVVIGLFQSRFPLTPVSTGFGARLGFLTGLSIALVMSILNVVELLVARFSSRAGGDLDKQFTAVLDQFRAQAQAQPGTPLIPFINNLAIPEFRAGFLLLVMAFMMAILILITTAGGAFAGFVRSRSRA